MTRKISFILLAFLGVYIISISRSGGLANIASQDRTGSPFSSGSCGNCHSGGSFNPAVSLTVEDGSGNSVTSYVPGASYTLKYSVTAGVGSPSGFALQSTQLTSTAANGGTLVNTLTANTRISTIGSRQYLEQNGLNSAGQFQATWTAPTSGTGNVNFFYAALAANGNGGTSGDDATGQSTFILTEACATPLADFNFSVNGATVNFTDQTTNTPTSWAWDFGDGNTSTTQDPNHTYAAPGNYTVCLISTGCNTSDTICKVVNITCANLSLGLQSQTNPACSGDQTGTATVAASGGVGNYSYLWNVGDTTATLANVGAGNYAVTVTDGNGCTASIQVSITEPDPLVPTVNYTDPLCAGDSSGTATVSAIGGTLPYYYLWNNGTTFDSISGLSAGVWQVIVSDSNNCAVPTSITLIEPAPISLSFQVTNAVGTNPGAIDLTASGGTPFSFGGYLYSWSNGSVSEDLNGIAAGTYTITVTDSNGCTFTDSVLVDQLTSLGGAIGMNFQVYPNPARDFVRIEADNPGNLQKIRLWDAQGRVIRNWEGGVLPLKLDLTGLPAGIFTLEARMGDKRIMHRIFHR